MSDTEIYDAFAGPAASLASASRLPCSHPGLGFQPRASGAWLELQWFPEETQNYGLADGGPSLMQGFGQLSACYRPGQGRMGAPDH